MNKYELDVLRLVDGRDTEMDWCWGAAMSECLSYLKSSGYVRLVAGKYTITDKGKQYLDGTSEQTS